MSLIDGHHGGILWKLGLLLILVRERDGLSARWSLGIGGTLLGALGWLGLGRVRDGRFLGRSDRFR